MSLSFGGDKGPKSQKSKKSAKREEMGFPWSGLLSEFPNFNLNCNFWCPEMTLFCAFLKNWKTDRKVESVIYRKLQKKAAGNHHFSRKVSEMTINHCFTESAISSGERIWAKYHFLRKSGNVAKMSSFDDFIRKSLAGGSIMPLVKWVSEYYSRTQK